MMHSVELSKQADAFGPDSPKKKSISRSADSCESDPWQAFFVLSVPYSARIDVGASSFALIVSVGPRSSLQLRWNEILR